MNDDSRWVGQKAEDLVEAFLQSKGLKIVDRNVSCRYGEIDIVAQDGKYMVFVEVRSVSDGFLVHPFETITRKKRATITKTANWYLKRKGLLNAFVRFDVVSVIWRINKEPELKWLKGAFDAV